MTSERDIYEKAMDLISTLVLDMNSSRLDMYYLSPSHMNKQGDTKVFVIRKRTPAERYKERQRDY